MRKTSKGSMKRTFTIHNARQVDGCPTKFYRMGKTGVYTGTTPAAAAKKALTKLCRVKRISGVCTIYITIRETTQGSTHKTFTYKMKRMLLDKPGPFGNKYYSVAEAIDESAIPKCAHSHKSSGRMSRKSMKRSISRKSTKKTKRKSPSKNKSLLSYFK